MYDMQYRKQVAKARLAGYKWSWARNEHLVNFIFLTRPVTKCVCGSTDHVTADHPASGSTPAGVREVTKVPTQKGNPPCFRYNKEAGCKNEKCNFKHVCSSCGGEHRVLDCRKPSRD